MKTFEITSVWQDTDEDYGFDVTLYSSNTVDDDYDCVVHVSKDIVDTTSPDELEALIEKDAIQQQRDNARWGSEYD